MSVLQGDLEVANCPLRMRWTAFAFCKQLPQSEGRDFDDANLLIIQWDGTQFAPLELMSLDPGVEVVLADTSDLWKSMS